MRHFAALPAEERRRLFSVEPGSFGPADDRHDLGTAFGAVLYSPATRVGLAADALSRRHPGLTTQVACLEDAVPDDRVTEGERQLEEELRQLAAAVEQGVIHPDELPLLFVRVRSPEHLSWVAARLGTLTERLAGFVLPKFTAANGPRYLEALSTSAPGLWAMPVLEGPDVLHAETRGPELQHLVHLLHEHAARIACIRLGATDLSGLYGIRRPADLTIYDVGIVRDCISDIVNALGRPGSGHIISGPVWEFYTPRDRVLKPQLRETPFEDDGPLGLRRQLLDHGADGLIRELLLDRANGLEGKTVIHPSHVLPVNVMGVVTHEDHVDALSVLGRAGGVEGSFYGNKMNEAKPHREWARRVMRRARSFGVLQPGVSGLALLEAHARPRSAAPR